MNLSFSFVGSLLFLVLAVLGTMTIVGSSTSQAWADVIEGTEGPDVIVGTPEADLIDSKGGMMTILEIVSLVLVPEMM
jgi:hypothetical protein